jgi:hypothetical protein
VLIYFLMVSCTRALYTLWLDRIFDPSFFEVPCTRMWDLVTLFPPYALINGIWILLSLLAYLLSLFDLSSYRYNLIIFIYACIILFFFIPLIDVILFYLKSSYLACTLLLVLLLKFPCLLDRSGALFLCGPVYDKTILSRCRVWFLFKFFERTLDFLDLN